MLISNSNRYSPYSVSILKNTNRIVSSTQDNFGGLRQGSFIKFGNENILYQVNKIQKFFFLKEFKQINNREILLNLDTEINLQKEDVIKITFDEYKLDSVLGILNPGKFYKMDETIKVLGGELSIDMKTGMGTPIKFKIDELNDKNGIRSISLIDEGKYIECPPEKCKVIGSGENAEFELKYCLVENRTLLTRTIKNIEKTNNSTKLTLDYSLPNRIKNGKISVEKWELYLANNFLGESMVETNYQIYKDFTPNLNIPLMVKNSTSFDLIFNQAMQRIDSEIQALKDRK